MLRDDFDDILRDYGYNVLLVRQDSLLRCSCWNEKTQEASRTCPVCFGLGKVPTIEKHTVRSQVQTVPQTLPRAVENSSMGPVLVGADSYYLRYNVNVSVQDLIVEVDWSSTGKPIYNGGKVNQVNFIDPKKFENGEVAYIKVYTEDTPVDKQIRGVRIANANGIKNYELIRG